METINPTTKLGPFASEHFDKKLKKVNVQTLILANIILSSTTTTPCNLDNTVITLPTTPTAPTQHGTGPDMIEFGLTVVNALLR